MWRRGGKGEKANWDGPLEETLSELLLPLLHALQHTFHSQIDTVTLASLQ